MEPYALTYTEARRLLVARDLSAVELTRSVLERIESVEPRIGALLAIRDRDDALADAARVDRFSRLGILTRIVLPLSAPALATTAILVFIFAWNEFLFALTFMTRDAARTVPVGISMLGGAATYEVPWGQIAAAIVITTLPLVAVVMFFQRRIVRGLTAGAVKA